MPAKTNKQRRYFGYLYGKIKSGDIGDLSERDQEVVRDLGVNHIREYLKKEASFDSYSSTGYLLAKVADMSSAGSEESQYENRKIPSLDFDLESLMGGLPALPSDVEKFTPRNIKYLLQLMQLKKEEENDNAENI